MEVKASSGSLKPELKLNLNLNLNLSPPRQNLPLPPKESVSSTEASPRSSCVSQETCPDELDSSSSSSGECSPTMMVVGCPRCLMYVVVLLTEDPKCPKCKSTVLLDFRQVDGDKNK